MEETGNRLAWVPRRDGTKAPERERERETVLAWNLAREFYLKGNKNMRRRILVFGRNSKRVPVLMTNRRL